MSIREFFGHRFHKIIHHARRRTRRRHYYALKVVVDHKTARIRPLVPYWRNKMTDNVTVGHQINYSFVEVDTSGNPMLTPVPVTSSSWANTPATPPVDNFTVAAGGATAVLQAIAAGSDTVTVTAVINGVTYTATDQVIIAAPPQVLGGIQIVADTE